MGEGWGRGWGGGVSGGGGGGGGGQGVLFLEYFNEEYSKQKYTFVI